MSQQAFELKESHKDDTFAGSFALADGKTFDLAEALKKGEGVIATDDPQVIATLSDHEAFKTTTVPERKSRSRAATEEA